MPETGVENRRRVAFALFLALGVLPGPARAEEPGLKVPPGFEVSLYADENLANDIYAMTLDAQGRVVVTSRGYIKVLHDREGRGRATDATLFATTATGGMGLCCDGDDLLFCGDGWLSRYRDADGDGRADGPPERLVPLAFTEHGGHAMRRGPDGFWYAIGGNDSGIGPGHATAPDSPIRRPEAGCLLRLTPDGRQCAVIAQGFRNPYDFDFNPAGALFTYDSDVERDAFLPWYSPTRVYHVGYAGHHGWRLTGFMRSWARKPDYLDTVDVLWPIGRGSPTGVACYRHDQFPKRYRGGLFALDWTFGKVFFLPLNPDGATYSTTAEVFIEPTGTLGFAPTDVAVAPDGALYISIGGRKTRGSVYRVAYKGAEIEGERRKRDGDAIESVLYAPQPLDAWSRSRWMPTARTLGAGRFLAVVSDDDHEAWGRVRAVEVVTELFGGLTEAAARAGASGRDAHVRARVAWSLGRVPCQDAAPILGRLASDPDPAVRLAALEALADRGEGLGAAVADNLDARDKRVRQAAARLATKLTEPAWADIREKNHSSSRARLTAALAEIWRHPERGIHERPVRAAAAVLGAATDPEERLDALRLIMLGLGDYHLINPAVEVDTAYSLAQPLAGHEELTATVAAAVRRIFPSGPRRVDEEAARLLAMLEDDDPATPGKVATFWTETSDPTGDMHFLIVDSRLRGTLGGPLTPKVARTILGLDRKLMGQEQRNKQSWNSRVAEVVTRLLARIPDLAGTLLDDPAFVHPNHVALALALPEPTRERAARKFLAAVREQGDFAGSGPLIELLATLPSVEVRPVLRDRWEDFALRDALLLQLAADPEPIDREKFLWGLDSSLPQVVNAALSALDRLPRDDSAERLIPVLRLLRRLCLEPKDVATRARALALIARQSGETFAVKEVGTDPAGLRRAYRPVFDRFEQAHPTLAKALQGGAEEDLSAWAQRLQAIDWERGDPARGARIFQARACETCHSGARALGPDLSGVTNRFSKADLFNAIVAPSLDVSPLYRTTLVETRDGQVHSGMVAFESADGVILQTGAATTIRLAAPEIVARLPGTRSLMPTGLLKDLAPGDLADLYAHLKTLTPRP